MERDYLFRVKFKKVYPAVSNKSGNSRQMEVRGRGREPHISCVTNVAPYQLP